MARTLVPAGGMNVPAGSYPTLPLNAGSAILKFDSVTSATDRMTPIVDGKTVIFAKNTDSGAHTITISSVPDTQSNRKGDITAYSVPAGETHYFGPFKTAGWADSGGLDIDVSSDLLQIAVMNPP